MKKDAFLRHPVHQLISDAQKELRDLAAGSAKGMLDLDEPIEQLSYIKWALEQSDPALVQERTLEQIQSRIQSLTDYIRSSTFRASLDPDTPEFIAFHADLQNYLSQAVDVFPNPRARSVQSKEAVETIADFKSQARTAVGSVRQMTAASQEILRKEVLTLKGDLDREKKLLKAQFDQVALLQQTVADYQASLSTDAAAKASQFDSLIAERRQSLIEWSSEIETSGDIYLKKIQTYYNLTTDTTLAGRFVMASREENLSYLINLAASVLFFGIAIVLVLWETRSPATGFLSVFSDPLFRWLGKVSLVAVCVIPASVFANQATKHRRAATWYRTVGVRIATLKPYLSEFSGDYTAELKEILKSFFTSDLNADGPRYARTSFGLKDLEESVGIIDRIKSIMVK